MDRTYFKQCCLITYQDHYSNYTQLIRFSKDEKYEKSKRIFRLGLKLDEMIVDGYKVTLKAIEEV